MSIYFLMSQSRKIQKLDYKGMINQIEDSSPPSFQSNCLYSYAGLTLCVSAFIYLYIYIYSLN